MFVFVCVLTLLQLFSDVTVVPELTHCELCDELWNWPMNCLMSKALALDAVKSGDAIIANAAAIAANAKIDFVFIVTCLFTSEDINFFGNDHQN